MFLKLLLSGLAAWGLGWQRIKRIFTILCYILVIMMVVGACLRMFGFE